MKKLLFLFLLSAVSLAQVTVVQSPVPKFRSFTPSGLPNVGGCVYTYASGTSTPQATYFDNTGLTANSNPVILDANGEAPIWITSAVYRFQVWTFGSGVIGSNCGNGTQLYQIDGVRDTGLNALNGPLAIAPTTNGIDILTITRATDVSPTGNFLNFKSLAGSTLFKVDISGNVTAGTVNKVTVTAPATGSTLTIADGKTLTANNSLTLAGTDGTTQTFQATDTIVGRATTDTLTNKTFDAQGTGNNFKIGGTTITNTGQSISTFLRGDGTWAGGNVSESTWSASNGAAPGTFVLNSQMAGTVFPSSHTLLRFTIFLSAQETACSPAPVWAFRDVTASSNLASLTVANSTTLIDSGALSVAMTAGDQFAFQNTTAGASCSGGASGWTATVFFK